MRSTNPPRLAALLLQVFAVDDAIAGDLDEEYQAGRSAAWYWRQTIAAVLAAPLRQFDPHELFAVQGMFMQIVMLALISVTAVFTVKVTAWLVYREGVMQMLLEPSVARELLRIVVSFVAALLAGVAIARVHTRSRTAAVLAFSTVVTLWAFVNLYVMDGVGNLDAVLPHVFGLLVFISGLLAGGIHLEPVMHGRTLRHG